jgi:NADH-quinone oxidoreductase subunit E
MSVRRLAEASVQPEGFAFDRSNAAWAKQAIKKYPKGREHSAVIPLLMRAQEQEGWVTKAAVEHVADMIGMPYIRALEVATFYTQFQLAPVGTKAHVQVCGTTPCMLRGSQELIDLCKRKIHPEPLHPNDDGTLSWEEVECQGACVNAPMVMIFKDTYEDLTAERLEEIIDAFEAGKGATVKPGPQVDRIYSAPQTGLTSLTEEVMPNGGAKARAKKPAGKAGASVPPSRAAKPKTAAPETDPSVKSPSPVKARQNGEKAASVKAPKADKKAADLSDPAVEGEARPRSHADKRTGDTAKGKQPTVRRSGKNDNGGTK